MPRNPTSKEEGQIDPDGDEKTGSAPRDIEAQASRVSDVHRIQNGIHGVARDIFDLTAFYEGRFLRSRG